MRTEQFRLIVWKDRTQPKEEPLFIELYDHKTDPYETINIAYDDSKIVDDLLNQFNKGWQGNSQQIN